MKAPFLILATAASLTWATAGCGVDEQLYNATVKDRDAQKAELAATKSDLDKDGHELKTESLTPRRVMKRPAPERMTVFSLMREAKPTRG